jgi:transposase
VRTEKSASQQGSVNVDEKAELAKLRKQNAQLKMEREILKKAAVFLAREVE